MKRISILGEFKATYVPYWLFDVDRYNCKVGFSGLSSKCAPVHYKDIIVCASNCSEASLLGNIEPWKMDQIQPFTLKLSEGVEVKPFTMEEGTAWRCIKIKLDLMNGSKNTKQLDMNHIIETKYCNRSSKYLFLPIYSMTYKYRGKEYQFVVNGSTAKYHGERPYSATKLASLSISGIVSALVMKYNK